MSWTEPPSPLGTGIGYSALPNATSASSAKPHGGDNVGGKMKMRADTGRRPAPRQQLILPRPTVPGSQGTALSPAAASSTNKMPAEPPRVDGAKSAAEHPVPATKSTPGNSSGSGVGDGCGGATVERPSPCSTPHPKEGEHQQRSLQPPDKRNRRL